MAEVNAHKTADSLWIVYKGKVYDLTKFIHSHPGGEETILKTSVAGQDCTEEFDDVGHSTSAVHQLNKFFIGELVTKN